MTTVVWGLVLVGVGLLAWRILRSLGSSGQPPASRPEAAPEEDPNRLSVDDMVLMDMLDDDLGG